jgi:hypothetical protein
MQISVKANPHAHTESLDLDSWPQISDQCLSSTRELTLYIHWQLLIANPLHQTDLLIQHHGSHGHVYSRWFLCMQSLPVTINYVQFASSVEEIRVSKKHTK